jgi:hypothetical protein
MTTLGDASAIHILKTIAQARLAASPSLPDAPDLQAALAEAFGEPAPSRPPKATWRAPRSTCSAATRPSPSLSRS